jgi:class 3 adenylate cyclase/tetratricopeptide (TPR) repeat protein
VTGIDDRQRALRPLLEAAAAACDRGDWTAALAITEAAAALDPTDPAVVTARARADAGAATAASRSRRRLTVMFCDLAGSTELASILDPEDTRELLHAYYETCTEIVRRHDGHIGHLVGDGVLIYFGYPRAHEDDGLRAVLTGLAIADAVSQLRSPTSGTTWDLKVRIGIHTGLAVISDLGSGSWTRTGEVVGETPNLAARIQTAAPLGTVVISLDTLNLVRDRVEVEALGASSLKGINRAVQLFRVLSVRPTDDAASESPEAVAVGREAERAALEHAWQEASTSGRYVVITGEPGIGKSHLVRHARALVPEGGRSLVLRCSALHSNTPLHAVAQLLLSPPPTSEAAETDDPLDRLTRVVDAFGLRSEENLYLLALVSSVTWPADRAIPDLQPAQARERTLTLLCSLFDALASEGPLMLVLEDLHWADPSTLDLLRRCVTEPRPHPMLILVTTRLAPETAPGEPTSVISLQALDAVECDELIDTLTGGRLDSATRTMVAERGDGVPLYVREVATMLDVEDGLGSDRSLPSVPPTLNDLLVARLDSVPQGREVVEALAVLGRPAPPALIAGVTRSSLTDVRGQLEVLERAGILRHSGGPGQFDFHHSLLRDAAYDVQLLAHRRQLHHRAAGALQEMYSRSHDDHPEELAHHYQLAGEIKPAVSLWTRAALQHASLAAHAEAIQSFELVLRYLPELDGELEDMELRARSGLAASLLASRGYTAPEVADAYGAVRELAVARSAQLEVSGLYGLWAYYHVTGDALASLQTAETLLARALALRDDQAALAARAVLGYQLQRLGRPTEALALLQQGRQWGAPEPLFPHHPGIGAGANLAMTEWLIGDFAASRASIEQAVAAAEALEGSTAHFTRAYTHAFAAELFQLAGDPESAGLHADRVVQVSSEFGFTSWLAAGMTNLKIAEALSGDLDAIPTIESCVNLWRAAGASSNLTQFGLGLALAYQAAGRPEDALAAIDQALKDASESQELYLEPELHRLRGELLTELRPGDSVGLVALEQALVTAATRGSRALELRTLLSIERRHRDLGEDRTAIQEIDRLLACLDPSDVDPEKLLVQARDLIAAERS